MADHLFILFREVLEHWLAIVTGSVVSLGILIREKWQKREVKWKTIVDIFAIGLLVSLFFAWQDEYTSAEWRGNEVVRLSALRETDTNQIVSLQDQLRQKDKPIVLRYAGDPKIDALLTRLQEQQQATKELNNKDLRNRAIALAARMRKFEAEYQLQESRIRDRNWSVLRAATTDAEKKKVMDEEQAELSQWNANYRYAFGVNFQGEMMFLHDELLNRVPQEEIPAPLKNRVVSIFSGMLTGPTPVSDGADWLETVARILSP